MLYEDKERQDFIFTIYHWWQALAIFTVYLWSELPMKVRLGGWLSPQCPLAGSVTLGTCQAQGRCSVTPFPHSVFPQAKLSIMLATLAVAMGAYLWMEHKLAQHVAYRLPRIPRPRLRMHGYCYLEENDSDETGSESDGSNDDNDERPTESASRDELPEDENQLG